MKSLINIVIVAISLVLVSACSSVYDKHIQWQTVQPEHFPVISGIGHAPISLQKSTNKTQRMLMAIKASKIAAYSEANIDQLIHQKAQPGSRMEL